MCGIFGCVGKIKKEKAYECIDRIQHRGPDFMAVSEMNGATFAHTRLSILDTSENANQPYTDISGRYCIVFNGEIYNFVELKEELEAKGYQFCTDSDTEVVLYAYMEWGEKFQEKCNGMWAIAIWDKVEKQLFLSRDRFGVKPLYIFKNNDCFYFASEMKAFYPIMQTIDINYGILQEDFMKLETMRDCCVRKVEHFPAGYCATYSNGKYNERSWWNTLEHLMVVPSDYKSQVEMLRELFLDACKIRMRSDVQIGSSLSGGIDSSSVVGAMNFCSNNLSDRMSSEWNHAFVVSMPNTALDETDLAEFAAQSANTYLHKTLINPNINIDEFLKYLYMWDEPYNSNPIPYMQNYEAIRDNNVKVVLDGEGADELFGGYSFDILHAGLNDGFEGVSFKKILDTYNSMVFEYSKIPSYKAKRSVLKDLKYQSYLKKNGDKITDNLNARLYWQTHYHVLPNILRVIDRSAMASGVEVRMPFLDWRIVSFAFSIPWTSKLRDGYTKAIERDMARPFMTDKILNRKAKIGFNAPLTEMLRGSWREFILDTVASKDFIESNLINSVEITAMVYEFYNSDDNKYNSGHEIYCRMMPYFWEKAVKTYAK